MKGKRMGLGMEWCEKTVWDSNIIESPWKLQFQNRATPTPTPAYCLVPGSLKYLW